MSPFTRELDRDGGRYLSRVTHLEMDACPAGDEPDAPAGTLIETWHAPAVDAYLALFRRVGEPWLWYGRLRQSRESIAAHLRAPTTELYRLWVDEVLAGFVELDRSTPDETEIAYFGLVPGYPGRGLGGYLLRVAVQRAWRGDIRRVWLHTCSEDHPDALAIYQHVGFRPFAVETQWVRDPRLAGLLPRSAAPHVPIPE